MELGKGHGEDQDPEIDSERSAAEAFTEIEHLDFSPASIAYASIPAQRRASDLYVYAERNARSNEGGWAGQSNSAL